jgi:Tfp pilus assembly protein PilN
MLTINNMLYKRNASNVREQRRRSQLKTQLIDALLLLIIASAAVFLLCMLFIAFSS